jgi:hypothetical protein
LFSQIFIHKINFEMIKCRMVVLTEEEKAVVADADMTMG